MKYTDNYNHEIEYVEKDEFEEKNNCYVDDALELNSVKAYKKSLRNIERLSEDEEYRLYKKAKAGDEDAINEIALHNIHLVYSIARKYSHFGVDEDELISEGYLALYKVAKSFDYSLGFKFSTYAVKSINNALFAYVSQHGKSIHYPKNIAKEVLIQKNAIREYEQKYGFAPTVEEIASLTKTSVKHVEKIANVIEDAISLDAPNGEEEEGTNWDRIDHEQYSESVEADFQHKVDSEQVQAALEKLSERERDVIELRCGFRDGIEHTREELSKKYNLSCQGIAQLERQAKSKLYYSLHSYYYAA